VRRYDKHGQKQAFVPEPKDRVLIREALNEQHESQKRQPTSRNGDNWLFEIEQEGNDEQQPDRIGNRE
jgi:hypothetical protein